MKRYRNLSVLAMAALVAATGFTSCSEDDLDTNQYGKGGVNILAFGPMPVTRRMPLVFVLMPVVHWVGWGGWSVFCGSWYSSG